MSIVNLMQSRPRLPAVASMAAAGSILAYLGKRRFDRACRNQVERGEPVAKSVWGIVNFQLCWPRALQVDVPVSLLSGPEAWLPDEKVPPLSFAPGSLLFGDQANMGAFMLGTWILRPDIPEPCSEIPSNGEAIGDRPMGTAGTAASYGLLWRLMDGEFREFIVEKSTVDFKNLPLLAYGIHVLYAQLLWHQIVMRLRKGNQKN
ncbi:hypothetical protein BDW71DRAFT_198841 [Aspergillus fruticulosus]